MTDGKRAGGAAFRAANESDVVSTPEGDGEYAPDELVGPVDGLQVAGGNAPLPYDSDKPTDAHGQVEPHGGPHHKGEIEETVEKTVDKLSLGQILT